MKKLGLGIIILSATMFLTGCLEEDNSIYIEESLIRGANDSSQIQEDVVYLPILDYSIIETTNTYEQPIITVLYKNNIVLIKLREENFSYSTELTTFTNTYLKASIVGSGGSAKFKNMKIVTSEEYMSIKEKDSSQSN